MNLYIKVIWSHESITSFQHPSSLLLSFVPSSRVAILRKPSKYQAERERVGDRKKERKAKEGKGGELSEKCSVYVSSLTIERFEIFFNLSLIDKNKNKNIA